MGKDTDSIEEFLSTVSEAIPDEAVQSHVLKLVDDFVGKNISGLKSKNTDLINENNKLKSDYHGIDSESVKSMLAELKDKSLTEYGDNIRAESTDKLNNLTTQLTESELKRQNLDNQYQKTLINLELRAAAERARVRPDAIDDFVSIHSKNFILEDGQARAGDQSSTDYVAGVLEKNDYWYPQSVGVGLRGSRAGANGAGNNTDFELTTAAESGDMNTYRKIRNKQKETG